MRALFIFLAAGLFVGGVTILPQISQAHGLEASGGIYTNYDPDFNRFFGNGFAATVAYSVPLSPNDVHVFAEVGYVHGEGSGSFDGRYDHVQPTVLSDSSQASTSSFTLWPFTLGIRTNLVPSKYRGSVGLYLGFGMVTMLTRYERPDGDSSKTPVLGGMIELRPQVRLSSAVALWIDPRLLFVSDAKYSNAVEINYGGSTLQFGISVGAP